MTPRTLLVSGAIALAGGVASSEAASGASSLMDAVKTGNVPAVRAVLRKTPDVNVPDADGATPLHVAVHGNDVALVDALITAGASVTRTNRYGVAPLSLAAENGNAAMIERLLKAGADPNTTVPGGETVLMTAARSGDVKAIDALIAHGAQVNARTQRGQTALMWAASKNDNAAAVRALIERGADLNVRTATVAVAGGGRMAATPLTGFTAFLFAVRAGNVDAARVLLDKGANVNDAISDGESALVIAASNTHWDMVSFLLDRGADPNHAGAGWNALHQTIRWRRPNPMGGKPAPIPTGGADSIDVVRKLIAKGVNVNARMRNNGMKDGQRNRLVRTGATAFLLAAKNADLEAMKVLLAAGADPSIFTLENVTPLMVASGAYIYHVGEDGGSLSSDAEDVLEVVKICVERGNDVNAVDAYGQTALHGAAFRGLNALVTYLVSKGAKIDARTNDYDPDQQRFLEPGEKRKNPDERSIRGWTPLAIANGLSYGGFYVDQPQTAERLRALMRERGISTDGEAIEARVHLDNGGYTQEREKKMDALAASIFAKQ